jgi:hypothetical protein
MNTNWPREKHSWTSFLMAWIGLRNSCRSGLHKDGRKWMA